MREEFRVTDAQVFRRRDPHREAFDRAFVAQFQRRGAALADIDLASRQHVAQTDAALKAIGRKASAVIAARRAGQQATGDIGGKRVGQECHLPRVNRAGCQADIAGSCIHPRTRPDGKRGDIAGVRRIGQVQTASVKADILRADRHGKRGKPLGACESFVTAAAKVDRLTDDSAVFTNDDIVAAGEGNFLRPVDGVGRGHQYVPTASELDRSIGGRDCPAAFIFAQNQCSATEQAW
ncbi:hypothetical protein NOLU111490_14875 [Novosphingobium lubricantis]